MSGRNQYPLGDRTKTPPGSPKHYVNLMDGLKRAERGEKEPWYVLVTTSRIVQILAHEIAFDARSHARRYKAFFRFRK